MWLGPRFCPAPGDAHDGREELVAEASRIVARVRPTPRRRQLIEPPLEWAAATCSDRSQTTKPHILGKTTDHSDARMILAVAVVGPHPSIDEVTVREQSAHCGEIRRATIACRNQVRRSHRFTTSAVLPVSSRITNAFRRRSSVRRATSSTAAASKIETGAIRYIAAYPSVVAMSPPTTGPAS